MTIKRYFAADMRQAMRLVKNDLGLDATILNQQKVAGGVEVLATLELSQPTRPPGPVTPEPLLNEEKQQLRVAINQAKQVINRAQQGSATTTDVNLQLRSTPGLKSVSKTDSTMTATSVVHPNVTDHQFSALQNEVSGMRALLEQQLGQLGWLKYCKQNPAKAQLWKKLQAIGFSGHYCQQLLANLPLQQQGLDAWRNLLANIVKKLPVTSKDITDQGGIFACVGPTGAGKTTTIGKLATRYALKHGTDKLALVTMDTFRIGATDQIKTLGKILNVPVKVVEDGQQLQTVLDSFQKKSLVLIDTAGLNHQDPKLQLQLSILNQVRPMVRGLLVLSTTSQQQVLQVAYNTYSQTRLVGGVLTKLDEASRLGEAIELLMDKHLAVSYVTDGQRIPDDIHQARAYQLISRAVALSQHAELAESELMSAYMQANPVAVTPPMQANVG
ncbi:flagellar biosynthesis protein FlhF [Spartinivicinus poritis]|uniref:Flagellar biosynthesis protein FlhF n=1 Tax=Spartinivicinus poritis TaxID=2994640 RepID=A0ABT5U8S1_9GAMM|nr:flagellar biosynthesis protein FlhF [Spartinivicinus sp. A2-2]MDE1461519.1 flagellar biosynthesis protein FlhF [Spartinivicinus sp. A2-2]